MPRYFDEQITNMRAGLARGYTVPRVSVINSAQIANGTLNVNETIGAAKAGLAAWLETRAERQTAASTETGARAA